MELYLRVGNDTLAIGVRYHVRERPITPPVRLIKEPANMEFQSIAYQAKGSLSMTPTLYGEPYVIDIDNSFFIRPTDSAEGYLFLPPLIRIADTKERTAFEVRSVQPKDAWYGDPKEGAPGMAARSEFLFESQEENMKLKPSWRIICPVSIRNDTDTDAEFTRMCIPTEGMSLYRSGDFILCDRVECIINPNGVQVDVRKGLPASFQGAKLVEKARQSPEARFFARGFSLLMRIAGR